MKKRYIALLLAFFALNVWAILRFTEAPPPEDIMTASSFDRPQEIGAVIFRRLYVPIGENELVVFGIRPNATHAKIVEGFLSTAVAEKRPFAVVFEEPNLEPIQVPAGTEVVQAAFNTEPTELAQKIRAYTAQGKRVLFYTVHTLSSHLVKDNPMTRFEPVWGKPVYTISSVGTTLRPEQEPVNEPPCMGSERDGQGTALLGCAAQNKGRTYFRKKLDVSRLVALMDQRGASDLLLFVSEPPVAK